MPNMAAGIPYRVSLVLVALAIWLSGGDARLHAQDEMVWTKEQIVERLARSDPEPLTRSLRGIVVGGGSGGSTATAEPAASGYIEDLRVTFPFDSYETDGVGYETYNASLSERRAQAVVEYLQEKFAIPGERLLGRGYGKTYLADPNDPRNPVNRRVEILNLGSG